MKYWAYLVGKLAAVIALTLTLQIVVLNAFPPRVSRFGKIRTPFLYDMPFTFAIMGTLLVGAGLFALAIRDQRRRCRTCLRQLIMPVASGSWGNILRLGRPQTEWICPFGHGTLRIDDLHLNGNENPAWEPHDGDIWKELESYQKAKK
ncbi:MAG TPA: hypothetical protein VH351_11250 [Bryobacteraceae bacterium]|jgi:hypothetical protein|nr:hypothetical protein [Bryobacteraceae bacterium]